ncbi:MAG: TonB-dependent receptor [Flavobacteriaceae bacterium]|jgi:hypothetical protein|nr:TonB-dependent receptor [Flavobacteriaceae bacterium]
MKYILIFLCVSPFALSQIKEERLILDKKREPEVKKIEKKKTSVATVKNYPPKEKKIQDSINLKYDITDVPAVSDFRTSEIQGEDISPKFDANLQNNYFRFGMGNFGKILADGNISGILENKIEIGGDVHFLSTSGLKDDYDWSSKQSSGNISAFINGYGEVGKFNINAEYGREDYNFYGIYAFQPPADIDVKQNVSQIKINGYYDFYSNNILNDIRIKSSFLSDKFKAKESSAEILLNLSKHSVDLSDDIVLNADLGIGIATQKTDFAILDEHSSNFFSGIASPKITFRKGESYLMLGSDFSFTDSKFGSNALPENTTENDFLWFPKAEFQFAATEEFKFYAGIDGGLKLNSYADFLRENPYLLPDQQLMPTETKYHFYFGLRGDVAENLKYDVSAGFAKAKNIAFFEADNIFDDECTLNRSAYDFANVFSTVYDSGNISDVKASVQYFPLENLVLNGELNYAKYDLENYENIYNKPLLKANIGAKFTTLEKKLLLGFDAIFFSDRTTNIFKDITNPATNPAVFTMEENRDEKVGGFADLNLSAEYKIHKNFSIFALGNNLLNTKYQTFNGYKVLGVQILGGVKIAF